MSISPIRSSRLSLLTSPLRPTVHDVLPRSLKLRKQGLQVSLHVGEGLVAGVVHRRLYEVLVPADLIVTVAVLFQHGHLTPATAGEQFRFSLITLRLPVACSAAARAPASSGPAVIFLAPVAAAGLAPELRAASCRC